MTYFETDRQRRRGDLRMNEIGALAVFGVKISTIASALIMAVLAVLLDIKRHTWLTAMLAVICGVVVAVLATGPLTAWLHLDDNWSHAVAGVLGISGRNLIVWISKVSKDPTALVRLWRGEYKDPPPPDKE